MRHEPQSALAAGFDRRLADCAGHSGASGAYLTQAYLTSSRLYNIIFLVPMVAAVGALTLIVVVRFVLQQRPPPKPDRPEHAQDRPPPDGKAGTIAALAGGMLVYTFSNRYVGFGVASALYRAFCLWIKGERRTLVVLPLSLVTAFVVTWLLIHGARVSAVSTFVY